MRSIVTRAGVVAFACASSLTFTAHAEAAQRGGYSRPFAASHTTFASRDDTRGRGWARSAPRVIMYHPYAEPRHYGYRGYRRDGSVPAFAAAGAAYGVGFAYANGGYGGNYGWSRFAQPYSAGYGPQVHYNQPQTYVQSYAVPTTVYQTVTRTYTLPVRAYRTVDQTRYVPVTSYQAVTSQVQVPVTVYQTYQQTEQVPVTVYQEFQQVRHVCGCSYAR